MISKIIQKEKERQEEFLAHPGSFECDVHKQSLINLKEYLEDPGYLMNFNPDCECCMLTSRERREHLIQLEEDKKELNKMIEKYK